MTNEELRTANVLQYKIVRLKGCLDIIMLDNFDKDFPEKAANLKRLINEATDEARTKVLDLIKEDLETQLKQAEKEFNEFGSKKNNMPERISVESFIVESRNNTSIDSIKMRVQEKLNEY